MGTVYIIIVFFITVVGIINASAGPVKISILSPELVPGIISGE
jgi:hypothetical protein